MWVCSSLEWVLLEEMVTSVGSGLSINTSFHAVIGKCFCTLLQVNH